MEWAEVINNPFLKDLPFKIELNKWGQILMTPASNRHGMLQSEVAYLLRSKLPGGNRSDPHSTGQTVLPASLPSIALDSGIPAGMTAGV